MATATDQTITLPVTGVRLPVGAAEWKVTKQRSMQTSDGVAFVATVTWKGVEVGTIENEGHGGGTWFRHGSVEALRAFDALCDATEAAGLAMQEDTFGYNGGEPFAVNAHEFVADALAAEHDLTKSFARRSKKSTVFVAAGENPTEAFRSCNAPLSTPTVLPMLKEKFPGGRAWDASAGAWIDL